MRKLRLVTAIFSVFLLAACGSVSPTASEAPCNPEVDEQCDTFGTIGSNNSGTIGSNNSGTIGSNNSGTIGSNNSGTIGSNN
jgi:outer membrane lipoprotein SlyB